MVFHPNPDIADSKDTGFFDVKRGLESLQELPFPPIEEWEYTQDQKEYGKELGSPFWHKRNNTPSHLGFHNVQEIIRCPIANKTEPKWWTALFTKIPDDEHYNVVKPNMVEQDARRAREKTEDACSRIKGQTLAYIVKSDLAGIQNGDRAALLNYASIPAMIKHTDFERKYSANPFARLLTYEYTHWCKTGISHEYTRGCTRGIFHFCTHGCTRSIFHFCTHRCTY
jgi:hypothetical protein